jgi:hypothetical protein
MSTLCARCGDVPPAEDSFGYCRLCLLHIDCAHARDGTYPFTDNPVPRADIERARLLALERGWKERRR